MVATAFRRNLAYDVNGRREIGADFTAEEIERIEAWGAARGLTSRRAALRELALKALEEPS